MAKKVGAVPTQADKRRNQMFYDQHRPPTGWYQSQEMVQTYGLKMPLRGRPWFASIEKESGGPTGLIQALFAVPHPDLLPPQKYMEFPEDQPGTIRILYAEWMADLEQSLKAWNQERIRAGALVHGSAFDPHAPATVQLVQLIGNQPMSPLPVKAMMQGNSWALGFTEKRPPQADRFFPLPSEEAGVDVFTETEDFGDPVPEVTGATSLAELMAEVEARCPPNLTGSNKNNWIAKELKKMATQEA